MIQPVNTIRYQTHSPVFKSKQKREKQVSNERKVVLTSVGLLVAGLALWKLSPKRIDSLIKEMNKYPKDVEYRKALLKDSNLPESEYYKLRSIIGVEELNSNLEVLSKDKENFLPGKKHFHPNGEVFFPQKENVANGKFAANLHTHTIYSDGKFTIQELLDQGAEYGNKRVEQLGKDNPFFLALTDHDTLAGCKEAIDIIYKNPEKYKNLRLILGIENTTIVNYPDVIKAPVQVHMLSYGINPYDKALNKYFDDQINVNKSKIRKVIDLANKKFGNYFSYEEFVKMVPPVEAGLKSVDYYMKDYLQFKLIYSTCVENKNFDFKSPISKIEKHPDYSKGQKYYDYYFKSLKSEGKVKEISADLRAKLNEIEYSSELHVSPVKYNDLEKAVKFLSTQKDGVLGIAHPGVAFPFANLKGENETLKLYDMIYRDFKEFGKEKAVYAEDNYGVYYKNYEGIAQKLSELSEKYGLKKSGGLDTHIPDIFASN